MERLKCLRCGQVYVLLPKTTLFAGAPCPQHHCGGELVEFPADVEMWHHQHGLPLDVPPPSSPPPPPPPPALVSKGLSPAPVRPPERKVPRKSEVKLPGKGMDGQEGYEFEFAQAEKALGVEGLVDTLNGMKAELELGDLDVDSIKRFVVHSHYLHGCAHEIGSQLRKDLDRVPHDLEEELEEKKEKQGTKRETPREKARREIVELYQRLLSERLLPGPVLLDHQRRAVLRDPATFENHLQEGMTLLHSWAAGVGRDSAAFARALGKHADIRG